MTPELCLFLKHLESQDAAAGTIGNYRTTVAHFMAWFAEETRQAPDLANITSFDIRQYRDLLKRGYKPATINRKLTNLSVFFRWGVVNGYTNDDPTQHIRRVSEQFSPRWLTRPEIYKVLRRARQGVQLASVKQLDYSRIIAVRTYAIVVVLLSTGLRVSELCDLKLGDIRLSEKAGLVTVRWGKGGKRRQIPLNTDARRALREWLQVRLGDSPYVFVSDGGRLSRQLVQWHLSQLGRESGVHLSPHLLRHTFGKSLVDAGEGLERVAQLMGHADVKTTAIYTMPSQGDLQRAVDKISWED